jgi:hypothetical protein
MRYGIAATVSRSRKLDQDILAVRRLHASDLSNLHVGLDVDSQRLVYYKMSGRIPGMGRGTMALAYCLLKEEPWPSHCRSPETEHHEIS